MVCPRLSMKNEKRRAHARPPFADRPPSILGQPSSPAVRRWPSVRLRSAVCCSSARSPPSVCHPSIVHPSCHLSALVFRPFAVRRPSAVHPPSAVRPPSVCCPSAVRPPSVRCPRGRLTDAYILSGFKGNRKAFSLKGPERHSESPIQPIQA